jgi:hypothetical protein
MDMGADPAALLFDDAQSHLWANFSTAGDFGKVEVHVLERKRARNDILVYPKMLHV